MKRLESNVTSNSAIDRITRLKNKALGLDTSCNIIKDEDHILKYKNKPRDLRSFKSTKQNLIASEKIKQIKSKCVNETKLKKIVDCSNINYEDAEYKVKETNTLRTFTNNKQEKFSSDKISDLRKKIIDPSNCNNEKCNIIKPKEENLTYKHVLKAPKRAYQNIKSIFSYADRNKKLTDACSNVKTTTIGSNVGVIKNLTECTEVELCVEDDTITSSTKSYSHKKYESDFPDLNSSERTDALKQKTKFENLRDDTTAYYVDENLEGLKYQETKVAPDKGGYFCCKC